MIVGGLGEVARPAIGPGGVFAALLAVGEALVDAIAVRLIGNHEHAAIGQNRRTHQQESAKRQRGHESHNAPVKKEAGAYTNRLKELRIIKGVSPSYTKVWSGSLTSRGLDVVPLAGPLCRR